MSHRRSTARAWLAASTLALALVVVPNALRAQSLIDAKAAAHIRDHYVTDMDSVHAKVMALANAIPEDKYAWRPSAGVRSVSEVLMHIATEWLFWGPMSIGGKPPADFGAPKETIPKLEKIASKSEVLAQLNKAYPYYREQLTKADAAALTGKYKPWDVSLIEATLSMVGDQHEHLGQLIAYARSNGVKPPWTK